MWNLYGYTVWTKRRKYLWSGGCWSTSKLISLRIWLKDTFLYMRNACIIKGGSPVLAIWTELRKCRMSSFGWWTSGFYMFLKGHKLNLSNPWILCNHNHLPIRRIFVHRLRNLLPVARLILVNYVMHIHTKPSRWLNDGHPNKLLINRLICLMTNFITVCQTSWLNEIWGSYGGEG